MKKHIINFLEIQGYLASSCRENEDNELIIRVSKKCKKNHCPECGRSRKISVHARGQWRLKKHSHFQEKQVYLEIKRRRLVCLVCKVVFSEKFPDIPRYARKTQNFVNQSLKYLSKNSFNEVSKVNQISYTSLKQQLYNHVDPYRLLEDKIKWLASLDKIYLGLDGQSYRGRDMVLTITEVKEQQVITVLPSELKTDLVKCLKAIPLAIRLKVVGIAMDMTNKHKSVLEKYFPNAKIVIDHYHVVQYSISAMQNIRRTLQLARHASVPVKQLLDKNSYRLSEEEKMTLNGYFDRYPEIERAYYLKERICHLYKIADRKKAEQKFKIIKHELLNSGDADLMELGRTLSRWEDKILNYFSCRITNAYTEGIHTKCKLIKRKSYGFRNVDTYVRKLILGIEIGRAHV